MKRPCLLHLSLRDCEAILLMLARSKPLWRIVAHEIGIEDEDLEERIDEAHRAGLALAFPSPHEVAEAKERLRG